METPATPLNNTPSTPAIGVGGLIFDDAGRVLLVCRKHPPQAGLWHIPGGRLEPGETLTECCRREVLEETGIEVTPSKIVAVADRNIEGFHYIIIDFLAKLTAASPREPHPSTDAADACWVRPDDLTEYPLVTGLEAVIRSYQPARVAAHETGLSPTDVHPWLYASPCKVSQEKLDHQETSKG
jgi:ADP-ribose pyrophosphatase YjhB (NUDIX family)